MTDSNPNLSSKNRPRCVQACDNCRRRKERCNGLQPCQRCRVRNVGSECHFEFTTPVETVKDIVDRHRVCVGQFDDGFENDGLGPSEFDEHRRPHVSVCHIKHVTYANIQLLTMPFLIKRVLNRPDILKSSALGLEPNDSNKSGLSHEAMALACIDAGISLVGLFDKLLHADQIPRRLPMVVYAMFYVALSLGLAIFGDLDSIFSLQENIQTASKLLTQFGKHDWLAGRYATIIGQLQRACKVYVKSRSKTVAGAHRARIRQLFGSLNSGTDTYHKGKPRATFEELDAWRTNQLTTTVQPQPAPAELDIEGWEISTDPLALESFSFRHIEQCVSQGLDNQPSKFATEYSSLLAGDDAFLKAPLLSGVWFGEEHMC